MAGTMVSGGRTALGVGGSDEIGGVDEVVAAATGYTKRRAKPTSHDEAH